MKVCRTVPGHYPFFNHQREEPVAQDIFTDGAVNVAFAEGMVRIEFASLVVTEVDGKTKQKAEVRHRLVLTPQGFLRSMGNMERALDAMMAKGLIESRSPGQIKAGPGTDVDTVIAKGERRAFGPDRRKRAKMEAEEQDQ